MTDRNRQLRLKKLKERALDPQALESVSGGKVVTRPDGSRYCTMTEPDA